MRPLLKICFIIFVQQMVIHPLMAQWEKTSFSRDATAFAVKDSVLFIGTDGDGVYVSTNLGHTWGSVNAGIKNKYITSFALSNGNIYAGTWGSVYRSSNNGQIWELKNNGLVATRLFCLTSIEEKVFAGTDSGVFITTNAGEHWYPVNNGLPKKWIFSLGVQRSFLFAGVESGGLYRSTDYGISWSVISGTGMNTVNTFFSIDSLIYIGASNGVFFSTNEGDSWQQTNYQGNVHSIVIDNNNIFIATFNGVYRSIDKGISWILSDKNNGFDFPYAGEIAIVKGSIFASTMYGHLYKSTNAGEYWATTNAGLASKVASDGVNLYSGGWYDGVCISTDNGGTWTRINNGLGDKNIRSLLCNGGNLIVGTDSGMVFLSTDKGQNWVLKNFNLPKEPVLSLSADSNLFFAGTGGGGVYYSTDYGNSWKTMYNGVQSNATLALYYDGQDLFAGTYGLGVIKYSQNGDEWERTITPLGNYVINALIVKDSVVIAGAAAGIGVLISTDNGKNWSPINSGLPLMNDNIQTLVLENSNLFAGTQRNGVFLSQNGGSNWVSVSEDGYFGADKENVTSLAVNGSFLFAGSSINGVSRRLVSEMATSIERSSKSLLKKFELSQNYPNPFNPITRIGFSLAVSSYTSLRIFDLLGREVNSLISEELPAGAHSVLWDASGFSSGVYFYKLQSSSWSETKKLILLR